MKLLRSPRWIVAAIVLFYSLLNCTPAYSEEALDHIEVTVPDYTVESTGGVDYVELPGGDLLLVDGKPEIPRYSVSVEYPEGYRVTDVVLRERGGMTSAEGLKLPTVAMEPASSITNSPDSQFSQLEGEGWYPEEDYNWKVLEDVDGKTTLVIVMYPFYYNSTTTEVKFYKTYSFDIEYIVSKVAITTLSLDKDVYQPGDKVKVDVWLNNSGEAQDVRASMMIKEYGTDEVIDGLPLRVLADLAGDASLSMEWDSSGTEPGYYYAEVGLADIEGNTLDTERVAIHLTAEKVEGETLSWDINEDGRVDYRDLAILGAHYGETLSPPYPRYDINQDGIIDLYDRDLLIVYYEEIA